MKNFKKYLDKISGKEIHNLTVTIISPYNHERTRLSFDLEIESAYLTEIFKITFYVSNRLVNGEPDEDEFDFLFKKSQFQEEFKMDTYDNFFIIGFGIELEDFEIDFIYK